MASVWGTGMGVVSYSGDIALLSLTKAASRSILVGSGSIFIVVGFFTKLIALFNGIPMPILAASSVQVGMITSIGISNLSYVKMDSSRNLIVVGFSLFVAIGVPEYLGRHPGSIDTGSQTVDNILEGLLLNGMLVGAVISIFLDLVIPGTPEERGANWRELVENDKEDANCIESSFHEAYRVYDLPFGGKWLTKQKWTRFIPFSPTFQSDTEVDADDKPHFELMASE
ncbi:Solute carrier family 23 member 1 [Holothuria leucospilota]|uniref:Solute carrier family 23 member 1 n=1 Tax=Holothuria leucospilota TaxID=206669 RepID=A0A9Q1HHW1_HOLLE|nr:Solute carrier family 23 member 1 [Holothuria leucospilota]